MFGFLKSAPPTVRTATVVLFKAPDEIEPRVCAILKRRWGLEFEPGVWMLPPTVAIDDLSEEIQSVLTDEDEGYFVIAATAGGWRYRLPTQMAAVIEGQKRCDEYHY